jgi:Bacterial PH domain
MALIGVSIAIQPGNADHSGTAPGYIAFGSAVAALVTLVTVYQVTARLTVGEHGLTWGSVMRTRSVRWADIQDVLIVPTASMGSWYRPAIRSGGRLIRVQGVAGSHRYIESIVAAISDAQLRASGAASIAGLGRTVPPVT